MQFIFGKDLKQCPTFSKLKTLLLDDRWCVAPDFPALSCILKHSPVLEKLTLHLFSKVYIRSLNSPNGGAPMVSPHSRSQALVKEEGCGRLGEPM